MKTYKEFSFISELEQFTQILLSDAAMQDQVSNSHLPSWDMSIETEHLAKTLEECKPYATADNQDDVIETRYIALREQGCEAGTLEYVKDRCQTLGTPTVLYKVLLKMSGKVECIKRIAKKEK